MKLLSTKNLIAFTSFLFLILFFSLMIAGSFSLENLDGKNVNLSDYQGSPLVIDFWSSWCGPCIKEASILSEAEKEWSFRGIKFIGIAVWDESDQIKEFMNKYNIQYDIVIDKNGSTAVDFGVIAVPEKFFVTSDGSFAFKINGPNNKKSLDGYLSRLLEEDKKNNGN